MVRRESRPSTIGHITLGTKQTDAPSAGNPHAGCDVAGAGDGFTVWLLRHSQRKRGAMARLDLRNTAPVLDPTGECAGIFRSADCQLLLTGQSTFPEPGPWKRALAILYFKSSELSNKRHNGHNTMPAQSSRNAVIGSTAIACRAGK